MEQFLSYYIFVYVVYTFYMLLRLKMHGLKSAEIPECSETENLIYYDNMINKLTISSYFWFSNLSNWLN